MTALGRLVFTSEGQGSRFRYDEVAPVVTSGGIFVASTSGITRAVNVRDGRNADQRGNTPAAGRVGCAKSAIMILCHSLGEQGQPMGALDVVDPPRMIRITCSSS